MGFWSRLLGRDSFFSKQRILGKLQLIALIFTFLTTSLPEVVALDSRDIDIVSISWEGAKTPSFSLNSVKNIVEQDVSPRWRRYTSYEGDYLYQAIDFKVGKVLNSPIEISSGRICESQDSIELMFKVRKEAYKRLNISDFFGRYLVIIAPDADCIWSGRATIGEIGKKGGTVIMHNNNSGLVLAHELGHTMGLGHSNFLRCDSGKRDGSWGDDCKAIEYGGTVDIMGNIDVDSPLSTYHQWRLGLIKNSEIHESWLNESIEISASDVVGKKRAIFIRDGQSTYWIEYRRASLGNSYKTGLVVFRTDPPPITAIVSPNPDDTGGVEFGRGVLADLWMLNLDNYTYSRSQASGSMTLQIGKIAQFFSGNISITALDVEATGKSVKVVISRKSDITAPPAPELTDPNTWTYSEAEIITPGYQDKDSKIQKFELDIAGKIVEIEGSTSKSAQLTYLNPINLPKTLLISDLPEGQYIFSVRGVDFWGNKSDWSRRQEILIDRSVPNIGKEVSVQEIGTDYIRLSLPAIKDNGSGLCLTQLVNEDGFVLQSSQKELNPSIMLKSNSSLQADLHVYDCLGNGVQGNFEVNTTFVSASRSSKTGKWTSSTLSPGAMTCNSKCSASFSMRGSVHVLLTTGEVDISVNSKKIKKIIVNDKKNLSTAAILDLGTKRSLIRISGTGFTLAGLASVNLDISNIKETQALASLEDRSLTDSIQRKLSTFGFTSTDFSSGWSVLPMARGTTLEDPTLDLCNSTYQSESGRQYRRQVTIFRANMPYIFLSNEVVKYKDSLAASQALQELKAKLKMCIEINGGVDRDSTLVKYSFFPIPKFETVLLSEDSRVIVRCLIGSGDNALHLFAVYQFEGEMFSGLYVTKSGDKSFSDSEIRRWLDASSTIAYRLRTLKWK